MKPMTREQVAIVMTEVFLRRLTPSLIPFVGHQNNFRIVSIHRPIDELLSLLTSLKPSGLITEWLPEVTEALLGLGLPTVIADTDIVYEGAVSLDIDDWAVGGVAGEALLQAGFRNFGCLGNGTPYSGQRIDGFLQAVDGPVSVYSETAFGDERYSEHFVEPSEGLRQWLESLKKPVGIFAVHDPLGRFLCSRCQELGISVPEQVAVIGANNDELVCGLSYPMLSSVSIPWGRLGALAGEALQELLSGRRSAVAKPRLVAPGGVVMRNSANHLLVEDAQLRRAMSYLSENLQEPISIGEMCDELRLARRSLERKFREYYRSTPWEMLCRMRIARAKDLLTQTNHSIGMIAELCGFNDPERMTVVFKRIVGAPPSRFRKLMTH